MAPGTKKTCLASNSLLSRLSVSWMAFSMPFFWMKAQASSTLSLAMTATVTSIASCCCGVMLRPRVTIRFFRWFLMAWVKREDANNDPIVIVTRN